ncbi:Gamma-aminobutyric acid receptor subunit alpha-4 [Halotydeus destructor]|nr:Gamma-aminobutyric acid receptor subunit alpha-4 [Halotydeus destructor]
MQFKVNLIIVLIAIKLATSSNPANRTKGQRRKFRFSTTTARPAASSNFTLVQSSKGSSSDQLVELFDNKQLRRNVSHLLDSLLLGYDNHLRPNFGGPPLEVLIDLHVRSMGPVSEIDMSYSMDCYFRQTWQDVRLSYDPKAYQGQPGTLALSISMLDRIWKPDTYFYNGKNAYMHTITVPNKFVRIYTDGRVLYSSRMTVKASCPMQLASFPMDIQRCPLEMGSFGYSVRDVTYKWNPDRQVVISEGMKMSQFILVASPSGNVTGHFRKDGPYSRLVVSFHLERLMGSFIIEVYAPCIMLVVLSWVSFWINREATADRIALGITTVLTMTFLGLETRTDLPKVSYMTALDYFVGITFVFIFATIVQFAVVHYYTKVGSGEYYFSPSSLVQLERGSTSTANGQSDDDECDTRGDLMYRQSRRLVASSMPTVHEVTGHSPELDASGGHDDDDDDYYDYEDGDEDVGQQCPIHGRVQFAHLDQDYSTNISNAYSNVRYRQPQIATLSSPQFDNEPVEQFDAKNSKVIRAR